MRRRTFLKQGGLAGLGLLASPWAVVGCRGEHSPHAVAPTSTAAFEEMPLLVLEGPARERGRIHGESLRVEIQEMVDGLTEWARTVGADPADYAARIVRETGFLDAAERWVPHVVEEIRGIAEGSGIDFETIFVWNLNDEAEWYLSKDRWVNSEYREPSRCSVFGASSENGNPSIVAQNADVGPDFDGAQTMLHIKHDDSELEEFVLTLPGTTGIWGMSNRSIGLCMSALTLDLNPSPQGLATTFIARGVLHQQNLDDAIDFITGVPHASGEAFIFGNAERVVCFEGSANRVAQYIPHPGATRVAHTNHVLVSDDFWLSLDNPEKIAPEIRDAIAIGRANSRTRLEALERRLADVSQPVTVDAAKAMLCSHDSSEYPVCRHDERGYITTYSMIMELSDPPTLHVAPGPGCRRQFQSYRF